MRVLIVKTSSMGDVVHALPAVSDLAAAKPGVQIDWLVEKSFATIPQQHGSVQRVIALQWRKWRKSFRAPETQQAWQAWRTDMKREHYDLVIDLQGLFKSAAFACFAEGPRAGYDWHSAKEPIASLFYGRKAHVSKQLHAVDRCRQAMAQLVGYPLPTSAPQFGLNAQADAWRPGTGPYAMLIPCASRPEKLWPEANWVAVGQALQSHGLQIGVLWGNPEEERRAHVIATALGAQVPPFLTVAEASDTLAHATVVVGLDTGMTHLAAAHGRPTLGIYCDHDPGLAGVTGSGPVISLGGKGQVPSLTAVLASLEKLR